MIGADKDYFKWLCYKVTDHFHSMDNYSEPLGMLHSIEFTWVIPRDSNRAVDGINLRTEFVDDTQYDVFPLDGEPCTVLEMMVALAERCERTIMCGQSNRDRTSKWFWYMIGSLRLSESVNRSFNPLYVSQTIDILLTRKYGSNGYGGLFYIPNYDGDLRNDEIWIQMNRYLTSTIM